MAEVDDLGAQIEFGIASLAELILTQPGQLIDESARTEP
jgi:hypothetical protein